MPFAIRGGISLGADPDPGQPRQSLPEILPAGGRVGEHPVAIAVVGDLLPGHLAVKPEPVAGRTGLQEPGRRYLEALAQLLQRPHLRLIPEIGVDAEAKEALRPVGKRP